MRFGPDQNNFKLGLDIHGVIDADPAMFSQLAKRVLRSGGEVHIITGAQMTEELKDKLKNEYGMEWTSLFSIADYHKEIGTQITYEDKDNPWMSDELWDETKAEHCRALDIDLHIDDTERYGKYFTTPFLLWKKKAAE